MRWTGKGAPMQHSRDELSFGSRLRAYRSDAGLTQEELAERAGLSRRGIADLERGVRRTPYTHTLERLRAALDLSDADYAALVEAAHPHSVQREPDASARHLHNLPLRQTSFVGRETDRMRIASLLDASSVVTLVGPGGVGKTRLALEVAEEEVAHWPDGVWLVELAAISDPDLLAMSVAAVLDVQQSAKGDLVDNMLDWLRTRRLLLVLDNCEHMVEACAQFVSRIARTCAAVRVLATSREVLGVDIENVHLVQPLVTPARAAISAESALASDAVRLFVDRAVAAAPGFSLTDGNAPAVALICERLDGVPLALELTAARLRAFAVEEISTRLDQRFSLLTSGQRTQLPRHRTLRALVDWSYDLLDDQERGLFEQLSVFSGGWTLDAVEAICTVPGGSSVEAFGRLIDKSLVRTELQPDGSMRYSMLETLREYAVERLSVRSQAEEVHHRHADFYATALARWWGETWWSESMQGRLLRIAAEYANLQSSLRWLLAHADAASAQRVAASLTFFWSLRGRVEEGRNWLITVLSMSDSTASLDAARAAATIALMQLDIEGGNRAAAIAAVETNLSAIRAVAEEPVVAQALIGLGWLIWVTRHDAVAARVHLQEGLALAGAQKLGPLEALGRTRLSALAYAIGDYPESQRLLEENKRYKGGGGESLLGYMDEVLHARMLLELGDFAGVEALLANLAPHVVRKLGTRSDRYRELRVRRARGGRTPVNLTCHAQGGRCLPIRRATRGRTGDG
jgi:non-specific serine/threonine protein kinase